MTFEIVLFSCCSIAKSCLTHCDPMNCSTPGSFVLLYFLQFAQIYILWIGDAIYPSHPLLPPSLFAFNLSQHQGLFQWVSSLHQVAKESIGASASILPMTTQGWFPLGSTGLISLLSRGLSGVFSSTTVQRHQFFGAPPSLQSSFHNRMWQLGRP